MKSNKNILIIFFIGILAGTYSCEQATSPRVSTAEDREQLFNYIIEKTKEREAFSIVKNEIMNFDPIEEMLKYKQEIIDANTDEKLFNVISKISNARRDRHLRVTPVDSGLIVNTEKKGMLPVRFRTDFTDPKNYFLFIGDMSEDIAKYTKEITIDIGDKLLSVNNTQIDEYIRMLKPYIRYSSINGMWKSIAEVITIQSYLYPITLSSDSMLLELEKTNGKRYEVTLSYKNYDDINWQGYYKSHGENRYKGFEMLFSKETYDLYISKEKEKVLLLDWYGFRGDLVKDMDYLVNYAAKNNMLDYAIIWDGTRSRGGSKGAYAIQKLFPKPFKTTFGNVKISDVIPLFIAQREVSFKRWQMLDHGVTETIDDGSWLMDWLRTDVQKAIDNGDEYSNNVPFKLAHLPKESDGFLQPAEPHFTGAVVCLFYPKGGSHLDQFAAMVVDNNLAYTIGMPTGGYSNTWEWSEILTFPLGKQPVVEFMWSIGHTIRPNGEVLEGNPAQMDKYIPETRDNYLEYYNILLDEAYHYLKL